jgi:hypothetical protein
MLLSFYNSSQQSAIRAVKEPQQQLLSIDSGMSVLTAATMLGSCQQNVPEKKVVGVTHKNAPVLFLVGAMFQRQR